VHTLTCYVDHRCAGKYVVYVEFSGTFGGPAGAVRGSPFSVDVLEGAPKERNQFGGGLMWESARELLDAAATLSRQTFEGISREVSEGMEISECAHAISTAVRCSIST
jgi:hypothetical protein